MNPDNKWGPLNYLSLGGIIYIIYSIFRMAKNGFFAFCALAKWVILILVISWMYIIVFLLWQAAPPWLLKTILVAIVSSLFLIGYNNHITTAKDNELKKEQAETQEREFTENKTAVEDYLASLTFHYYDFEKKMFMDHLIEQNLMNYFHAWDESFRLHVIGTVTGKFYVCSLSSMTSEQRVAKREAAWEKQKDNQRQAQLKRNAEIKKARLESQR